MTQGLVVRCATCGSTLRGPTRSELVAFVDAHQRAERCGCDAVVELLPADSVNGYGGRPPPIPRPRDAATRSG